LFSIAKEERLEKDEAECVLSNIDNVLINGTQLILNHVFRQVGFDKIGDEILQQLVMVPIKSAGEQVRDGGLLAIPL
jgi:hypothetical protein